ncbi:MAG TPA: sensor histidine kinase, partial [Sphingomicrobium sp.]
SITARTAESSPSVEDMAAHLNGRLDAFARVQSAVTRNPDAGVDIAAMVSDELLVHAAHEGEQLSIDGPEISLWPKAAESFSLAIHELATNAVKHGALTAGNGKRGKIAVKWKLNGSGDGKALRFEWVENGLDGKLAKPTRSGFGMELLTRILPYDLGAKTKVEFPATGLRFLMDLPANHVAGTREKRS